MNTNHMIFFIEGNIGSGKSTLIERMARDLKQKTEAEIYAYPEPLDIWTGIKHENKNLLELLYDNPQQYAQQFQTLVLITMQARYTDFMEKCINSDVQCIGLFERSHRSQKIFQKQLLVQGCLSQLDMDIYNTIHIPRFIHTVHIYLQLDPEICYDRIINKRKRPEVNTIELKYLQDLHELHEAEFSKDEDIIINNNFVSV